MRNIASLSLEQAPPYHIPLRFFISAPIFAMVAALVILFSGSAVFASRWAVELLAVTHLMTLGYMSMVMLGAMLQMLPVLAGVPVPKVVFVGGLVHLLISVGCVLMAGGFLWYEDTLLLAAVIALVAGFVVFTSVVGFALYRAGRASSTVIGMRFALFGLLVVVSLGVLLTSGFTGLIGLPLIDVWADVHLDWGVLGWFGTLLIAVAYQVVPMFQVTSDYPLWMRKWLLPVLLLTLTGWSLIKMNAVGPILEGLMVSLLLMEVGSFAITTLWLLYHRKRKVFDKTVLFWRAGIGFFLATIVVLLVGKYRPQQSLDLLLGVLIVQGVVMTMINGMLYRIVPFLSWFHLQHAQVAHGRFDMVLPHMKLFISDQAARIQFYVHLVSLLFMAAATIWPEMLIYPAAALFFISNLLLLMNLGQSWQKYSVIKKQILPVES